MATIEVAKLLVVLEGDAKSLQNTLSGSEKELSRFGKAAQEAKQTMSAMGSTASQVAGKAFAGFSDNLHKIGNVASSVALGGIAAFTTGVAAAGVAVAGFIKDAAPVASIKGAFEGIAGEGADRLLAEFDKATGGMVAQRDIMTSYNKAAQLVNKDFADRLPDAMQYLGKVSAATGQDLGFLLDSLVTGTGRLSPMILDNLGIQVSLSEANEAYAASVGKSVDELTKAEQQTALTNQVMEKLAENTASMPDIVGSASGSMATLKATIQDAKDSIGMALLPILEQILPPLIAFGDTLLQAVLPAAQMVGEVVERLAFNLGLGVEPARALQIALQAAVPPEIADFIMNIVNRLIEFKAQIMAARDTIMPFVEIVMQWLDSNVQIEAVLTAIGIAIASIVVPAFVSMLAAVLPVVATFAVLVAGVQLVYNTFTETLPQMVEVWRNNFEMLQNIVNQIGWSGLGKKIIEGIINGIKSAGGGLIDTMKGLAQQAIAAAKGALGIKSPSRVAAQEIGKPLAQGVAQGVMDASTAPVQAMGALASHTVNNSRVSNYNLTVHSERAAPTIQQDFAFMQAKAGALT